MLIFISSALIVAYTIFFCIHTASKKQCVSPTTGKCISMAVGMVSSTMIGLLLALLLPGELAFSTVLSIVVSCIFAYFIGKHFGATGIIEALSASFMGAMMGAMLGDMVPENRQTFLIVAMDIIYLLSILLLMLMVNKEAIKSNERIKTKVTPLFLSIVLSLSIIGIGATIEMNPQNLDEAPPINHEHHH
jgi:hypothetical protein